MKSLGKTITDDHLNRKVVKKKATSKDTKQFNSGKSLKRAFSAPKLRTMSRENKKLTKTSKINLISENHKNRKETVKSPSNTGGLIKEYNKLM